MKKPHDDIKDARQLRFTRSRNERFDLCYLVSVARENIERS